MQEILEFRPHHFMCTLGFRGVGYSNHFVQNYKEIVKVLTKNEDTLIKVVKHTDNICSACPKKISKTFCTAQDKITGLDFAHNKVLRFTSGEITSWRQAKSRIKKYMSIDKFHESCQSCSWKKFGVCQESLEQLLNSN